MRLDFNRTIYVADSAGHQSSPSTLRIIRDIAVHSRRTHEHPGVRGNDDSTDLSILAVMPVVLNFL